MAAGHADPAPGGVGQIGPERRVGCAAPAHLDSTAEVAGLVQHRQYRSETSCYDQWRIRVRRHRDGRAVVYGVYEAGEFSSSGYAGPGYAGELLDAEGNVAAAIRRVGRALRVPERTITDCVARLPVERV
jgi:hypothetical protein